MKITRSREHTVNLTNYENVKFGGSVEVDTEEFKSIDDGIKYANRTLDDLLREDLVEALANVPEGNTTHAESWRRR